MEKGKSNQKENKYENLENQVKDELSKITDSEYAETIASNILCYVKEDIEETADDEYNSSDVAYAIGRVLAKITDQKIK